VDDLLEGWDEERGEKSWMKGEDGVVYLSLDEALVSSTEDLQQPAPRHGDFRDRADDDNQAEAQVSHLSNRLADHQASSSLTLALIRLTLATLYVWSTTVGPGVVALTQNLRTGSRHHALLERD
jgi:hypothetical protein